MGPITAAFDQQFFELHTRRLRLLEAAVPELVYARAAINQRGMMVHTFGEMLLRSAAVVEQIAGGITARLWDDPFEWTLPEKLNTKELIVEYFNEVETVRKRAFAFIATDNDLARNIPSPEEFRSLALIFASAISRSSAHLAKAEELYKVADDLKNTNLDHVAADPVL